MLRCGSLPNGSIDLQLPRRLVVLVDSDDARLNGDGVVEDVVLEFLEALVSLLLLARSV